MWPSAKEPGAGSDINFSTLANESGKTQNSKKPATPGKYLREAVPC